MVEVSREQCAWRLRADLRGWLWLGEVWSLATVCMTHHTATTPRKSNNDSMERKL